MKKINKKTIKRILFTIGVLGILLISPSLGRYLVNTIKDSYLASKSFYFNSDKLTWDRRIYQIDNWSGVDTYSFTINLNNELNNLVHANTDIEYEISYICSTNATCLVSKSSGTLYQEARQDQFTVQITPNTALSNNDEVSIEVIVESTYPYSKTISGKFILKVGIPGIAYEINDVLGRAYFDLAVTNTTDYYLVKTAFDSYQVNQRIDYQTYSNLSEANKEKCALPLITLTFDPSVVILDMTSNAYQNAETFTTTTIGGNQYVNSVSFRIELESSVVVKFYKANTNMDYSYPFINTTPVVAFAYSQ